MGQQTTIHYLYHSGFSVETQNAMLIFDYWQGELKKDDQKTAKGDEAVLRQGRLPNAFLKTGKPTMVFASHRHGDHFDPIILDFLSVNHDIRYVFSDDIVIRKPTRTMIFAGPYETLQVHDAKIVTYGSTDEGISFAVYVDGLCIFHAGDFNWWHWPEESTPEELAQDEKKFRDELQKMDAMRPDIAFFPVDPRLGSAGDWGAKAFATQCKPNLLIPMHFQNDFDWIQRFADRWDTQDVKAVRIERTGQKITYKPTCV